MMLALSPTLFSINYEWPLRDNIDRHHQHDCTSILLDAETNLYDSVSDFPTHDQIRQDYTPESSNSSGGAINRNIGSSMKVSKKLNHNASERDRRKRVNDIYAYLRALMPISADQKKKLSIPRTVSLALEYIPELRKEVETLICKKEKLSLYTTSATRKKNLGVKGQISQDGISNTDSSVVSSVSILGEKVIVIQLIFSMDCMSKNKEIGSLSRILTYLESGENGFVLLNLTTFKCSGGHMLLNTLHLQVQGDKNVDAEMLKEKLCQFSQ